MRAAAAGRADRQANWASFVGFVLGPERDLVDVFVKMLREYP